jgi:hypothetical protein
MMMQIYRAPSTVLELVSSSVMNLEESVKDVWKVDRAGRRDLVQFGKLNSVL